MLKELVAAVAGVVVTVGAAVSAPLEDGAAAYGRGDYATAFRLWKPLAEQGTASAEYGVGLMYDLGQGVARDYGEALKWYQAAANQNYAFGEFGLGTLYFAGHGVRQDDVRAYMWLSLAAAQGLADAATLLDLAAKSMTADQITDANRLVGTFVSNLSVLGGGF